MIVIPPEVLSDDTSLATALVSTVILGLFEQSQVDVSIGAVQEIIRQIRVHERDVAERGRKIAAGLDLDGGEDESTG